MSYSVFVIKKDLNLPDLLQANIGITSRLGGVGVALLCLRLAKMSMSNEQTLEILRNSLSLKEL